MIWFQRKERYKNSNRSSFFNYLITRFCMLSLVILISGCPAEQGNSQTGFADRSQHFDQQPASNLSAGSNRESRLTERFNRFDRNGDGAISSEELDRPALFQRLDQNNDGLVTFEEAKNHRNNRRIAHRNNIPTDDQGTPVNSSLSSMQSDSGFDASSSDDESPRQFRRNGIDREHPNQNRSNKLTERFGKFDKNGDGVLSPDEVNRPELFQRLDQNSDGLVTLEEARAYRNNRRQLAYNSTGTNTNAALLAQPTAADATPYRGRGAKSLSATDGDFKQYPNIRYADLPGVDPNLLSLDIYAPKIGQDHPVILMIHGGGWQRGDKAKANVVANKARYFTENGYVFVSINYRLSPAVKHPVPAQDVARAIAWTHGNIGRYQGDPDHIYLMGHSAGAHLAALVATDQRYLQATGKNLKLIKGVILLDGAGYDIPRLMREHNQPNIYVAAFGKDERTWKDASPITHIASGKNIPPFLIFYTPRPRAQMLSENLRESLLRAGVTVQSKLINKSHKEINQEIGNPNDEATRIIMDFLTK